MSKHDSKVDAINRMIEELYSEGMQKSKEYEAQIRDTLKINSPIEQFAGVVAAVSFAVQLLVDRGLPPEEIQRSIVVSTFAAMTEIAKKTEEDAGKETNSKPQSSKEDMPN